MRGGGHGGGGGGRGRRLNAALGGKRYCVTRTVEIPMCASLPTYC